VIPLGYLYKNIMPAAGVVDVPTIVEVHSASSCISPLPFDHVPYWRHNDNFMFDTPGALRALAHDVGADLSKATLFYFASHEQQFDRESRAWVPTRNHEGALAPADATLEGFDVTTHYAGDAIECSPLSCNGLATSFAEEVNPHCLFRTMEAALAAVQSTEFVDAEPGLLSIIGVYTVR
jgi:hypothetical protein